MQINHCFIHEVVNIFISSCVDIFIHQERGNELLIRGTIKERSLGTDSGSVYHLFEENNDGDQGKLLARRMEEYEQT